MTTAPAAVRDDGVDRRWLFVAVACGVLLPLASPFTGELRARLRAWSPASFRMIVTTAVVVVVAGVVVASARRLARHGQWGRGLLGLTAAIGSTAAYVAITATGNADVDAIERVHLVEYGLLAWLFHHAWRREAGWGSLLLPACASIIVAAADETVQWFVPFRVGEFRDLLLDGVAAAAGLLTAISLQPPTRWRERMSRRVRRRIGAVMSVAIVASAVVIQVAHLGWRIDEPGVAVFWSRFTRDDLVRLAADRRIEWATAPPLHVAVWSREDQYLAEGLWHAQARNVAWTAGDLFTAWRENLILERFFDPVLEWPSDGAPTGARWSAEQHAVAAGQMQSDPAFYLSRAAPLPILAWPSWAVWLAAGVAVGAVITAC